MSNIQLVIFWRSSKVQNHVWAIFHFLLPNQVHRDIGATLSISMWTVALEEMQKPYVSFFQPSSGSCQSEPCKPSLSRLLLCQDVLNGSSHTTPKHGLQGCPCQLLQQQLHHPSSVTLVKLNLWFLWRGPPIYMHCLYWLLCQKCPSSFFSLLSFLGGGTLGELVNIYIPSKIRLKLKEIFPICRLPIK